MSTNSTPPPDPSSPVPPTIAYAGHDPCAIDASHLNSLSVCHFVWGALIALFACLGLIYVAMGVAVLSGRMPGIVPATSPAAPNPMDDRFFGIMFTCMGVGMTTLGWLFAGCTIASGVFLRRRRRRVFSIVIAAINCASFPFGTVLGVFTLMVLMRDSVRSLYEEHRAAR